jgi:hypothetical protein
VRSITILLLTAVCGACGPRAVPQPSEPVPAPENAPVPAAARRPPPPPVDHDRPIPVCVLRDGVLREVPARYDSRTGDTTTLEGLTFGSAWPLTGEYAVVAGWYVNREPIPFRGRRYALHGRPRVLGIDEVTRVGEYRGVGLYADARDTASAARVVYLPYRPGCEFQPYMDSLAAARP